MKLKYNTITLPCFFYYTIRTLFFQANRERIFVFSKKKATDAETSPSRKIFPVCEKKLFPLTFPQIVVYYH